MDDSGFIRVAIPAKFTWRPGQHCFLRFTSLGLRHSISSHPFTICSLPSIHPNEPNELVFYIRPQGGFTAKLRAYVEENPNCSISVLVEGPYGGINMQKYTDVDHILVVAGGSGAGWCLPFVEQFARYGAGAQDAYLDHKENAHVEKGFRAGSATRPVSLRLVLATRDTTSRAWFLGAVDDVLAKYRSTESFSDVRVEVHLTGDAAKEAHLSHKISEDAPSPSGSSSSRDMDKIEVPKHDHQHGKVPGREVEGRPRLPAIVEEEAHAVREGRQSLSVFVCGPITMQNDVRNAVAAENLNILRGSKASGVYLHSEHFSWA